MKIYLKKSLTLLIATTMIAVYLFCIFVFNLLNSSPPNIFIENRNFLSVMVNNELNKDASIGIIFGLISSLFFYLIYLGTKHVEDTPAEKLSSNFIIYLNLYITTPFFVFIFHILDWNFGWTTSGVFIPMGLVSGSFLSILLLLATIIFYVKKAKNCMSTWQLIVGIFAPFLIILLLLIIYPLYFEFSYYLRYR